MPLAIQGCAQDRATDGRIMLWPQSARRINGASVHKRTLVIEARLYP